MSKVCIKCNKEKEYKYYPKRKDSKDGYRNECKDCKNKRQTKYMKTYDKSKIREWNKNYEENNREKRREQKRKLYHKDIEKSREKANKKYQENKDHINKLKRKKYQDNIEEEREKKRIYRNNNREHLNEKARIRDNKRYENDISFRLIKRCRARISEFLKEKDIRKNNTTLELIGLSKEDLRKWIEFNCEIDNLTDYHIDHLKPLNSFDLKNKEDIFKSKCNHWTNLKPLLPEVNLEKSDNETPFHLKLEQEIRIKLFGKIYSIFS